MRNVKRVTTFVTLTPLTSYERRAVVGLVVSNARLPTGAISTCAGSNAPPWYGPVVLYSAPENPGLPDASVPYRNAVAVYHVGCRSAP